MSGDVTYGINSKAISINVSRFLFLQLAKGEVTEHTFDILAMERPRRGDLLVFVEWFNGKATGRVAISVVARKKIIRKHELDVGKVKIWMNHGQIEGLEG